MWAFDYDVPVPGHFSHNAFDTILNRSSNECIVLRVFSQRCSELSSVAEMTQARRECSTMFRFLVRPTNFNQSKLLISFI